MFSCLFAVAFCGTSADLLPPFTLNADGKVGYWELAGSAIREDEYIMLVPPIQYKRGAIWSNVELPKTEWSIEYEIRTDQDAAGGQLGFWFVDRYGADGDVGGGPSTFQGFGVVMTLRRYTRGAVLFLGFHFLQHPLSASVDHENLKRPMATADFSREHPVKLLVTFRANHTVKVSVVSGAEQKNFDLYDEKLDVDLTGTYAGVTAQSDMFETRFDLTRVAFYLPGTSKIGSAREVQFDEMPKSNYIPDDPTALRNPYLEKTSRFLAQQQQAITEKKALFSDVEVPRADILDIIDEITWATQEVASFKELNDFVSQHMIPYTHKWHKRTLKIVDQVKEARNVYGVAWNYTHDLIRGLNASVQTASKKAAFKMLDLQEIFTSESQKLGGSVEKSEVLKKAQSRTRVFVGIALAELVVIVIFFFLMQSGKIRRKLVG